MRPSPTAAVLGGGPAGLMAAEHLARAGWAVDVYEHMPSVGRKLLLAGRSGLNLTHAEPLPDLLARYGDAPLVQAAVAAFGPDPLRAWAAGLGQATFVGSSGRVFPTAMRATPLLRAWLRRLDDLGVQFHVRSKWLGWAGALPPSGRVPPGVRVGAADGSDCVVAADAVVLALGGASWPRVGSDGTWVGHLVAAGIAVAPLQPANCGVCVEWSPEFAERFAGMPLKNVALAVPAAGTAGTPIRGDITITRGGLESGPVYTLSSVIRERITSAGDCLVTVDLHPDLTLDQVAARLARRRQKDSLTNGLRRSLGLSPPAISLLREATGGRLPTDDGELAALITATPLRVTSTTPLARAISTAGGIALAEVDDQFMLRRLPGVFVAGEMLDWEAPTGGYLLQASFSTAVAAAAGATKWLQRTT
jgi:uncharacterized flavoprotein (TIGR03862 family)